MKYLTQAAYAGLIYVSGKDIYVAGYDGNIDKCWKNGVVAATLGSTAQVSLSSMYVSGSDIYILANNGYAVLYYKNGVPTYLADGAASYGHGNSIFVITI